MHGGTYMRGPYTWSNTSVRKGGLICGGLYAGGGAYRRRNMVFHDILGIIRQT